MVYYYAYLNSANICEQVYAMPSPISGSNYILLDSYDTSLIGKRYNNGVWEEVTWYYYAKLDDRDIVIEIVSNPDNPLPAQNDLISISSADTSLVGKWYNRETEQFVEAPIHVLAMHSTDEINVGTADKWLTTEINEINTAIDTLETAVAGKADTAHTHTEYAPAEHTHTGYAPIEHTHNYAAAAHSHAISDVTELNSTLTAIDNDITALETSVAGKAAADHTHNNYAEIGHTHTEYAAANHNHNADYAAAAHTHTAADITGLPSSVDAYSKTETDALLNAKLNASAYTADDVLTKLKTVDGQNSGLDADMLDGHDTDYFATATQLAGKAAIDHTHTGYAAENHTHSGYAAADHTHSNYAVSDHTHTGYATTASVTELETALSGKADSTHNHDTAYSPINHAHTDYATVTALNALADDVDGKAAANHTHNNYAAASHNHAIAEITGLETALSGKASTDHTHSNYATTDHTHTGYATTASLTVVENALDNKANTSHTHAQSDISGLANALAGKASTSHTHSEYAASNHTHSGYASSSHTHSDYLSTSGGTVNGNVNVNGIVRVNGQQSLYDSGTMITLSTNNRQTMIAGSQVYSKTTITVSSDERLKENINPANVEKMIDFINGIEVKTFNYIDDENKTEYIGVIAQELQKANPDIAKYLVFEREDGYYGVKISDLVFPLISAVQELTKRVNALENK